LASVSIPASLQLERSRLGQPARLGKLPSIERAFWTCYEFPRLAKNDIWIFEKEDRMPRTARPIGAAIALLALALSAEVASQQQLGPLLVLAPVGTAEQGETLRTAMAAHLSGYSVEVLLAATEPLPESFPDQADAARRAVEEHEALAAIWIDERHGMVFVLVAAPQADQILQRPLPGADEPWRARCDAVASMVHSALAPWLNREHEVEPQPAATTEEPAVAPPVPEDEEDLPPADHATRTDWLLLQVRAGYGPVFVNSYGAVQHGGRVAAGLIIGDHLEAEIALDLLFPLPAEIDGETSEDIALVRWPLRLAVAGFVTALDMDIGLKAGVVIDFTHISGVDPTKIADDTERTNPGFAASLFLRYRVLPWLAIWAEGGIDVFNSAYDYSLQGATVIRYSALQGRVSGGLAFLLALL
jgi:hypothetical protein